MLTQFVQFQLESHTPKIKITKMPFTFSHPAIVLPLKSIFGKWLSLTGLIIGSLTPDFEYFFRMKIQSEYSHTLVGTLWFNLPLGIILCFVYHNIIKKPFIKNAPRLIQFRVKPLMDFDWTTYFTKNWTIVGLSVIIGAYSHIFWDSFTHSNAFFTNYFELNRTLYNTEISIFKLLQHLSTLIGGIIIIRYFWKLKVDKTEYSKPNMNYWIKIGVLTIFILGIRLAFGLQISAYGNLIVSGITALMISLIIVSLLEKRKSI